MDWTAILEERALVPDSEPARPVAEAVVVPGEHGRRRGLLYLLVALTALFSLVASAAVVVALLRDDKTAPTAAVADREPGREAIATPPAQEPAPPAPEPAIGAAVSGSAGATGDEDEDRAAAGGAGGEPRGEPGASPGRDDDGSGPAGVAKADPTNAGKDRTGRDKADKDKTGSAKANGGKADGAKANLGKANAGKSDGAKSDGAKADRSKSDRGVKAPVDGAGGKDGTGEGDGDSTAAAGAGGDGPAARGSKSSKPSIKDFARAIEPLEPKLHACAKENGVSGTAAIKVEVGADGTIAWAAVREGGGAFQACVSKVVRAIRLPASEDGGTLIHSVSLPDP